MGNQKPETIEKKNMSGLPDYCGFLPENPECKVALVVDPPVACTGPDCGEPVPTPTGRTETPSDMQLMEAQLTFLFTAMVSTAYVALDLFRYRTGTFYDNGDVLGTNWWKLANQIGGYATMAIGSVMTVTQLLSMFGIAADVNLMVWMYGGMAGSIVSMIAHGMLFRAYDRSYSVKSDVASSAGDIAKATAVLEQTKTDMIKLLAMDTIIGFE